MGRLMGRCTSGRMGVSFNIIFYVPESMSADGSLVTWYSAIIAKGVTSGIGDQLAITGLLVIVHAIRIPGLFDASAGC